MLLCLPFQLLHRESFTPHSTSESGVLPEQLRIIVLIGLLPPSHLRRSLFRIVQRYIFQHFLAYTYSTCRISLQGPRSKVRPRSDEQQLVKCYPSFRPPEKREKGVVIRYHLPCSRGSLLRYCCPLLAVGGWWLVVGPCWTGGDTVPFWPSHYSKR